MKNRTVTLPSGQRMRVPQHIQRLDGRSLAGWQLRYHGNRYFADGHGTPRASLRRATAELERRIKMLPAPTHLKDGPKRGKLNGMPLGLSGPVVRQRYSFLEASLHVSLPRFGKPPARKTLYLGTETTYSQDRLEKAVAQGLAMRAAAESAYRREATLAKRDGL